jgi:hypothetical protein
VAPTASRIGVAIEAGMTAEYQFGRPDAECSAIDHLIADAAVLRSGCLVV